jgi:N-acetylglutamate synthase-like GNAT family acetyltransferase
MKATSDAPDVTLRAAEDEDLDAVEQLLLANDLPVAGVAEALRDFVVAESNRELVGVAGLEVCREHGLLRSTAVSPSWRDRGLGRQLVERIIANAEARDLRAVYLLTTTAEHYFPSFGFVTTTRDAVPAAVRQTAEFKDACPASATVMCLTLSKNAI